MPRNGGHTDREPHVGPAASGRATVSVPPIPKLPARTDHSDGHPTDDNHHGVAVASGGHGTYDTHRPSAPAEISGGGHESDDTHERFAATADDGGQTELATQSVSAPVITLIREHWRQRQDLHKAEKSLTNQIKGICRRTCGGDKKEAGVVYKAMMNGGDHEMAGIVMASAALFLQARAVLNEGRKSVEKRLLELTKELPPGVLEFVEQTRGFGMLGLAAIIGECGDLSNYAGPYKLNKRMGESVMPDGTRQRRVKGAAAIEHGYSGSRHSVIWTIGESLIKASGDYKKLYDERKAYEHERDPEMSKGHAHNRAVRYMRKRLLRDLWRAWRRATDRVSTVDALPAAGDDRG